MAGNIRLDFFSNSAAGTSGTVQWKGGKFAFVAEATFGSIKLQYQSLSGAFVDVANSTMTANGMVVLELPPTTLKAVATGGSAYYASLVEVFTNTRH